MHNLKLLMLLVISSFIFNFSISSYAQVTCGEIFGDNGTEQKTIKTLKKQNRSSKDLSEDNTATEAITINEQTDEQTEWKSILGQTDYEKYKVQANELVADRMKLLSEAMLPPIFTTSIIFNAPAAALMFKDNDFFKFSETKTAQLLTENPKLKEFSLYFNSPISFNLFIASLNMLGLSDTVNAQLSKGINALGVLKSIEKFFAQNDITLNNTAAISLKQKDGIFNWTIQNISNFQNYIHFGMPESQTYLFTSYHTSLNELVKILRILKLQPEEPLHLMTNSNPIEALSQLSLNNLEARNISETFYAASGGQFFKTRSSGDSEPNKSTIAKDLPLGHIAVLFISTKTTKQASISNIRNVNKYSNPVMVDTIVVYDITNAKAVTLNKSMSENEMIQQLKSVNIPEKFVQEAFAKISDISWSQQGNDDVIYRPTP